MELHWWLCLGWEMLGCPGVPLGAVAVSQGALAVGFSPPEAAECMGCWVHQSLQLLATDVIPLLLHVPQMC